MSTPLSHRRRDAAGAANAVDGPQVMVVAGLGRAAAVQRRRRGSCRTGPARCRGWPGRCRPTGGPRSPGGSARQRNSPLPVWTTAGPGHDHGLAAARRSVGAGRGRSARMATPLGFSRRDGAAHELEGLRRRGTARRETRGPLRGRRRSASPTPGLVHRQAAGRPSPRLDQDAAVHLLVVDRNPVARPGGPRVRWLVVL